MEDLQLQRPLIVGLPEDEDDPRFIDVVGRAVSAELETKPVHGLFVIRIDNWFDHKWLNFSGIGRVLFGQQYMGVPWGRDTALDEFRRRGRSRRFHHLHRIASFRKISIGKT